MIGEGNGTKMTYDMLRIDLLDKARILRKVHVRRKRDLVYRHFPVDLVAVSADEVFWLFEEVLRRGRGSGKGVRGCQRSFGELAMTR